MTGSVGVDEITRRFSTPDPTDEQKQTIAHLQTAFLGVAILVDRMCPAGRNAAISLTHLEEAMRAAYAAIAGTR